jgi:hypothetical protein
MDALAWASDHIAVVNRIKPYTDFSGEIESGWMKMMPSAWGSTAGPSSIIRQARNTA